MSRFLDALRSGRVLLMDGAMGTELQRAGLKPGECGELWNLTHPERVRAIHQAYVDAGAEVLLTNTFQANPAALARHKLEFELGVICQAAVDLGARPPARIAGYSPMSAPASTMRTARLSGTSSAPLPRLALTPYSLKHTVIRIIRLLS